jgi:hypothetical protein
MSRYTGLSRGCRNSTTSKELDTWAGGSWVMLRWTGVLGYHDDYYGCQIFVCRPQASSHEARLIVTHLRMALVVSSPVGGMDG